MTNDEYKEHVYKNLIEQCARPSEIIPKGYMVKFENRAVEMFEHEAKESLTFRFYTNDKITAHICISRQAAGIISDLIRVSNHGTLDDKFKDGSFRIANHV